MKKYLMILSFVLLIAGCKKKEEEILPQNPVLSPSSVTVEETQTTEVLISGGKSPYTVSIAPTGIATVVVNDRLVVTGIKTGAATATVKGSDGGAATLAITVTAKPDPLAAFKADATLRWEFPNGEVVKSDSTAFVYITDSGGYLFSSEQNKWGYASLDGWTFHLIEWGNSPLVRTERGTTSVTDFQLVKEEEHRVWITFKLNGAAHRVVAGKL